MEPCFRRMRDNLVMVQSSMKRTEGLSMLLWLRVIGSEKLIIKREI